MAKVTVECRNFTGTHAALNGVSPSYISRCAILRATITVGAQRFSDVFSCGYGRLLHRLGVGLSALSLLEERSEGLCSAPAYDALDLSEKGAVTYWYGMVFAKLVAESKLGVRWLAHVDRMLESGALTIASASKERPDLAGRGMNKQWHVLEAKGRTGPYAPSLVSGAKGQAARVIAINGLPPATTSACIASLFTRPIYVLLDDPKSDTSHSGEKWTIEDDGFFRQYYRKFIEYFREFSAAREEAKHAAVFRIAPLLPFCRDFVRLPSVPQFLEGLEIGLLKSICDAPERAMDAVRELPHNDDRIGSDGIALFGSIPDWEFPDAKAT